MSDEPVHVHSGGEKMIFVEGSGVGYASPAASELVPEKHRPVVSIGVVGVGVDGEPVHFGLVVPYTGAAQLLGQLLGLRDSLPDGLHAEWDRMAGEALAFANQHLPAVRAAMERRYAEED